jgi:transposase, IS5 family
MRFCAIRGSSGRPQSTGSGRRRSGRSALSHGPPTIPTETYARLMVVKQRTGWGYETLVREVSDSLHLRRFCLVGLGERVPDESTMRKLTRRLGPETVQAALALRDPDGAQGEALPPTRGQGGLERGRGGRALPGAGLAAHGVRALAREGPRLTARIGEGGTRVRDRSRAMGRRLRAISRTLRRRSGEAQSEVLKPTAQAGELLRRSVR